MKINVAQMSALVTHLAAVLHILSCVLGLGVLASVTAEGNTRVSPFRHTAW